jgi:hypothetical protein
LVNQTLVKTAAGWRIANILPIPLPAPRRRAAEVTPRHLPFPESSEVNSAFCRFHCTCGAHGTPRNAGLSSRSIMGFDVEGVANPSVCFALVTERKLDHP